MFVRRTTLEQKEASLRAEIAALTKQLGSLHRLSEAASATAEEMAVAADNAIEERDQARKAARYLLRAAVTQKNDLLDTLRESVTHWPWIAGENDAAEDRSQGEE